MRITSGIYKSRLLKKPTDIRPTQDKVRKALFDVLGERVLRARFLELFAGSGAVGIEALSRGAVEVIFVEENSRCYRTIEQNLQSLGIAVAHTDTGQNVQVLRMDSLRAIEKLSQRTHAFDLIFLDPPYYRGLAKKTLQTIAMYDIVAPLGIVIAEHSKKDILDDSIGTLTRFKQKRYADKLLSFYHRNR